VADLHTRLTAAVNARRGLARAVIAFEPYTATISNNTSQALGDAVAAHLRANDPATVIRHCERDLKVLERHAPEERFAQSGVWCAYCGRTELRDCIDITELAAAYEVELTE
jgi:hypothetical protein